MALNFQQKGSAFMRRVLLAVFLVASVAMVTVYAREGEEGPLHAVQNATCQIVSPLTFVGAAAGSGVDAVGQSVEDATANAETLSELREVNSELIERLAQADEYRQEAERLQQLLDMKNAYSIDGVGARVIGRSAQAWDQTVTLDKGSADGVDTGLTVMGSSGVVGQITEVSEHTSKVRLLTDSNSGAAAMIQSNRAEGIVRGSLEGLLYLEDLDADAVVSVGDVVLTSGLGGSYTRGLIVGTVVKVDSRQGDSSRRVVVAPNDSTGPLEEVIVVHSIGSSDGATRVVAAADEATEETAE